MLQVFLYSFKSIPQTACPSEVQTKVQIVRGEHTVSIHVKKNKLCHVHTSKEEILSNQQDNVTAPDVLLTILIGQYIRHY